LLLRGFADFGLSYSKTNYCEALRHASFPDWQKQRFIPACALASGSPALPSHGRRADLAEFSFMVLRNFFARVAIVFQSSF
jgi:hypothetical protein